MAHLPPDAAIFSPSVARAAASAAKDWAYIDGWLQRKFPGRGPPPFERNADTLRALLSLASANEAADEERALIARLEAETLQQLKAHEQQPSQALNQVAEPETPNNNVLQDAREAILTALESSLTREGQTALDALAALALQLGIPFPTPTSLGAELITLSAQSATLEQTIARVETLTSYMAREAEATAKLAAELRPPSSSAHHHHDDDHDPDHALDVVEPQIGAVGPQGAEEEGTGYHPPANLSLQNLETQRRIRVLSARLPELRDKVAALSKSFPSGASPSIAQVRREEEAYLSLLARKEALDAQVRAFQGLPPDTEQARQQLEVLRAELRRMTLRRDEVFEGLVERETPRKGGPRR
jgi:HAUS augmin-like complex subunit 1